MAGEILAVAQGWHQLTGVGVGLGRSRENSVESCCCTSYSSSISTTDLRKKRTNRRPTVLQQFPASKRGSLFPISATLGGDRHPQSSRDRHPQSSRHQHQEQQQQQRGVMGVKGRMSVNNFVMRALADKIATKDMDTVGKTDEALLVDEQEQTAEGGKYDYNWEKEWYPLYLTNEIPRDAPLALKVFDRSLVLFYDAEGTLNCLEDRCPHRLVKLSEGQIVDGKLECLYHGWQFRGDGVCAKVPQLPEGGKIPGRACVRTYALKESQGVVWVWMADKSTPDFGKLPWFEHYSKEGFGDLSSIHEMPYDHSILLENLMDPAHIPISHDRTDPSAKREDAQPLEFEVIERSRRGFAGFWNKSKTPQTKVFLRFESPCVIRNDTTFKDPKTGNEESFSALLLCRPAGQGKSMLIARFGASGLYKRNPVLKYIPRWFIHISTSSVLEEDMGFLSSQNEILNRENMPTKDLYLNLRSQDTWVLEFRKWLDKVGHGMPYYWGHRTISQGPKDSALQEQAPAGLLASASSSHPSKGAVGSMFARDPTNRYYRHIVHCKSCREGLSLFKKAQSVAVVVAALSAGLALAFSQKNNALRVSLVAVAALSCALYWGFSWVMTKMTSNIFRKHRFA